MAANLGLKRKLDNEESRSGGKKHFGHWSQGLLASMDDPELRVYKDDKITIIKDKYPKAKHHFLVMPKENIPNLKSLKKEHLDLLHHIEKEGESLAEKTDKNLKFRFGYHAVPSMGHLHMHVISQDFDSPCLKHKKHWNSFTTEYFVDSKDIIQQLEDKGSISMDTGVFQEVLKRDLRCHVCKKAQKNIPTLKMHIKLHDYKKS